jgi:NADPH2:quinone reductase
MGRAVFVHETGGAEVLRVAAHDPGDPGPGAVQVRLVAAGVNFIDVYFRTGLYPRPLPFVQGLEGAGVVEALGPDVSGLDIGDRVAWAGVPGSYAERLNAPADRVIRLPEGVSDAQAAAVLLQGMTAHYLAHGVAEHVIRYTDVDFSEEVSRLTDGRGVDVVYDSVGRATFEGSLRSLRPRGLMALFGQSSGPVPAFDLHELNRLGSLFITRPSLAHYTRDRAELEQRAGAVLGAVARGELEVRIGAEFPLADAADAHRALEGRRTTGKVLLRT